MQVLQTTCLPNKHPLKCYRRWVAMYVGAVQHVSLYSLWECCLPRNTMCNVRYVGCKQWQPYGGTALLHLQFTWVGTKHDIWDESQMFTMSYMWHQTLGDTINGTHSLPFPWLTGGRLPSPSSELSGISAMMITRVYVHIYKQCQSHTHTQPWHPIVCHRLINYNIPNASKTSSRCPAYSSAYERTIPANTTSVVPLSSHISVGTHFVREVTVVLAAMWAPCCPINSYNIRMCQ